MKLFKGTQDFFCLITCEHVIKREMVNQRKTIIDDNYTININNKSHSFLNNKTKNKNYGKSAIYHH